MPKMRPFRVFHTGPAACLFVALVAHPFASSATSPDPPNPIPGNPGVITENAYSEDSGGAPSNALRHTIYFGGDIITMEGDQPEYAEAVVQRDGRIIFVGSKADAFEEYGGKAAEHDLNGETMMPGFIEPHAHPVSIGAFLLAHDIVAPHEWRMPHKTYPAVRGKEEYLEAVEKIVEGKTDKSETVLIWGYHKSWHGVLTLADLEKATGDVPTVIYQRSTHEIYLNNAALKKYNIKETDISAPEQADFENNHFWERAYQEVKAGKMKSFFGDKEALKMGMDRLSQMMLQNGLTAMAEPSFPNTSFDDEYAVLREGTEKFPYYSIFLIPGFPEQFTLKMSSDDYLERIEDLSKYNTSQITFLPMQYKTFADGAIYSLALQLQEGFYNCPHCNSEWIIPPAEGEELFDYYWDHGYKLHIHITGDLAFEKYLDITERAMERNPREDHRTTFHHVGLFTAEQAERAAKLEIEISANPYYLWALADKYSETGMGSDRAENMVALHELTKRGVPLSLHSDFAMAPAEPLTLAWVAINRIVASGKVMRPDQKISVFDGMKGITISAARTLELEDQIGSIKEGKEATFTILKQNPFKIDPVRIKDIPIAGVVYKGRFKLNRAASEEKQGKRLLGGWSNVEVTPDVEAALDTVLKQMNTSAGLEKILSVKTQVVAGLNYDIDFQLDNGEVWNTRVFRDLDGNYSMTKTAVRKDVGTSR